MSDRPPTVFQLQDHYLEYRWIGPQPDQAPTIVFLHEGLGSTGLWRDFPDRLAEATGCGVLVYSRLGHGASDPVTEPRAVRFMHDEAFEILPAVLQHFGIADPILFGHSDGASISLLYAGAGLGPVRALVLEAPHVFVEPISVESIAGLVEAYETTDLRERLARRHGANAEPMFRAWADVWLRPEFREWNIEEYLPAVEVPVLVIQGEDDEYGTWGQVETVVGKVSGPVESLRLPECRHSPHRDQPQRVLDAARGFIRKVACSIDPTFQPDRREDS